MNLARLDESDNTLSPDSIEPANDPMALWPKDHVRILHPSAGSRRGVAGVARRNGKWEETAVPLHDLERYVSLMGGLSDVFMSPNSFYGWRRVTQLAHLGANYVDLDYHKSNWAGSTPEQVSEVVRRHLDDANLPEPSYILFTGRGLLVTWLIHDTNRRALPRWIPVQQTLAAALSQFGADKGALDAARVFRVLGSINSKSGALVRPVWVSGPADNLTRYVFEDLAREVLPVERGELVSLRRERAKRKAEGQLLRPATRLDATTLWEAYLTDLQRLLRHRWWGHLPPGQRDFWLFIASVAMSWLVPAGQPLQRECFALAKEVGGWSEGEMKSNMTSVFNRASAAARGEMIEFNGRKQDPRYRMKASTVVRWLDVTQIEMREAGLRVLVDDTVKREIDAQKKRDARGTDARRKEKAQAREEARRMADEGRTQAEIGAKMGVAQSTVARWLKH